MLTVLLAIQIIIAVVMVVIILLQHTSTDGLSGLGGSGTVGGGLMTGRASANMLTKATAVLITLFMLNSLIMATMVARSSDKSITEQITEQEKEIKDAEPSVPLVE